MNKEFRRSLRTTSVVLFTTVILLVTFSLGILLTDKASTVMRTMMEEHMLSVSNTASAMLDGDEFEKITEDTDTDEYRKVFDTLSYFRDNIKLDYIYALKSTADGKFVFVVDPDTEDPGEYGEPIVTTDAMVNAYNGVPSVEAEPHADRWGRFYSTYSPIYNSAGEITGVVGVDFRAEWYEDQIRSLSFSSFEIGAVSLLMGAVVFLVITARGRRSLRVVHGHLNELNDNIEELMNEVGNIAGEISAEDETKQAVKYLYEDDDMDDLGKKILNMQDELRGNIVKIREKAYIDGMTGTRNKTAYLEDIREFEKEMANGNADFSVAVFDLISLKQYNDNYGHEIGDKVIIDAADSLIEVFGSDNIYRVGGDEFVAGLRFVTEEEIKSNFSKLENILEQKNLEGGLYETMPLGISKGYACLHAGRRSLLQRCIQEG